MYICTHVDIYISIYIVIVQWIYIYIRIHGYVSTYNTFYIKLDVVCICMEANWRIRDKVEKGNYVNVKEYWSKD